MRRRAAPPNRQRKSKAGKLRHRQTNAVAPNDERACVAVDRFRPSTQAIVCARTALDAAAANSHKASQLTPAEHSA
jgi:hypothetical protein